MEFIPMGKKFGQLLVRHGFINEHQLEEALRHQETKAPHKPLGEICVDLEFISKTVLRVVLDRYRKGRLLGDVLLRMGVVSTGRLGEALAMQKKVQKRLGQILLDMRYITKADLAEALSIQLGIPKIVPSVYMADPVLLSKAPLEYYRRHRIVPLDSVVTSDNANKEIVTVLMEDPLDVATMADLRRIFNAEIQPVVSDTTDIDDFLNQIMHPWDRYCVEKQTGAPDMPAFQQTKEVSLSRDDLPESQVPLEAQDRLAATVTEPGDGVREAGATDVAMLTSPRPPSDVTLTKTPHVIPSVKEVFESEPTPLTRGTGTGIGSRPQKQYESRMSDLTRPYNRLLGTGSTSPARKKIARTKPEPETQDNTTRPHTPVPKNEPPKLEPTAPAPWTMAKLSDLSAQDGRNVELSAPAKDMVIDEGDCDQVEAGKNAVAMLNAIIFSAVKERASDIHIEPLEGKVSIRYRIDGVLRRKADLPKSVSAALTTRVKALSGLDVAERRRHQDGRIEARIADSDIDLRVSTYAALWGENVVIRILNRETALVGINELGLSPINLDLYLKILAYPAGIILVTGPTGCGKTTTLYASLMRLRETGIKIITVEDPVEYTVEGVVQGRLDSRPDLTYEDFIKSMMRQDPDVIMIGEIRDEAGAAASVQAALTGHKVLTSFHTDDTASALLRLMDMNIQPFLISSSLVGIMAQRLVRTLCPFCKEPTTPDSATMKAFTSINAEGPYGTHTFYRAVGCPECADTGYKGRTGVHELLEINEPVKEVIVAQKTSSQIRLTARKSAHMVSMAEDGFYKAAQGITTLEEVLRLVFINAGDAAIPYDADRLIAYCAGAEDKNVLQLPRARNRA